MSDQKAETTARVLALMDESFHAYAAGDRDRSVRALDEAIELDLLCVQAIHGGILIGEIPNPRFDPEGWAAYVADRQ